ncbi:uncharacterized protein NMK_1870 [Novimethylophilus kurashikiensis]|uniref:C2H2-type domain-containing protein n=1 Tax=Novimethylophilus kurashikiensis TaxID=1825523 RepID=A0A2R5F7V6_9PROT|nr:uncharacterized protein NMK_1870 [Novimethylophilus kurashikiensis]
MQCSRNFKSIYALNGHLRTHNDDFVEVNRTNGLKWAEAAKEKYYLSPKICKNCSIVIQYEKHRANYSIKFCSQNCAASFNNKAKAPRSEASKRKTSQTLLRRALLHPKQAQAAYSKLKNCQCAHCGLRFLNRQAIKYCSQHADLYKRNNRNRYAFTFSIRDNSSAFSASELALLRKYGMWSYNNTSGITRDHKISVASAIKNGYDPYYIKHPMNCELMPWADNNRKKTKSSLTYEELVRLVLEYDAKKSIAPTAGLEPASAFALTA